MKLINYLIPWPGPHVMFVATIFVDPLTIDIQSSPETYNNWFIFEMKSKVIKKEILIHIWDFNALQFIPSFGNIGYLIMKIYIPVPITELEIWTFWLLVTWIPSVLGLFPGAVTLRPETITFAESWNETWICWEFTIFKSSTIKFLQW